MLIADLERAIFQSRHKLRVLGIDEPSINMMILLSYEAECELRQDPSLRHGLIADKRIFGYQFFATDGLDSGFKIVMEVKRNCDETQK